MNNIEIQHNYLLSKGYVVIQDDDLHITYKNDYVGQYIRYIHLFKTDMSYSIGGESFNFGTMIIRLGYDLEEYNRYIKLCKKLHTRSETIKKILSQ